MGSGLPLGLGRGVVVLPGSPVPPAWAGCPRVSIGPDELAAPAVTNRTLHRAWLDRTPTVVELGVPTDRLRSPESHTGPVHSLTPDFEFERERLHALVWANNYDGRSAELIWWHGRKAVRQSVGRTVVEGGDSDIVLDDGTPVSIDGGPAVPVGSLVDGGPVVHRWSVEQRSFQPMRHDQPRWGLAADQMAAVAHGAGAARVIAPAGSGKTRVLTERLRHLVVDCAGSPGSITVLAYNTKAADEIRRRCEAFIPTDAGTVRTLNSLGQWICAQSAADDRRTVADEHLVRSIIQQVIDVPRQANTDTVAPYVAALSAIRLGLRDPAAVEVSNPDAAGVADGFDRYRSALADAGLLDFDEQIYRAIEVLLTEPTVRARAQRHCRLLLVDEFQDLTPAHVLLLRLLSAPWYDCFGVGDDDQVIYGYSGADPQFLLEYGRYFPGATGYALEVNYRCPVAVVEGAVHLLSYNRRRVPKEIRAADGADQGMLEIRREPADQLASEAVSLIRGWQDNGAALDEMVVLARVNSALLPVQVACAEAGVPCTAPLDAKVLERTGSRTALAYLRMGLDPGALSPGDIRDTIRRPSRGIAPRVVDMLVDRRNRSVTDIRRLADRLSGRDVPKLLAYADDIERVASACLRTTAEALLTIREDIGLGGTMGVLDGPRSGTERSTHTDDLIALGSVATLHPDPASFESWLRSTLRRPHPDGPGVLLSTVHRIKGREWDNVIVFGASQGGFPHRLSDDEEGERRVFHVAVTRGRRHVVVLASDRSPSIFVGELDGSRVVTVPHVPVPAAEVRRSPAEKLISASASAAEAALRAWRRSVATDNRIPAYVVLNDRELVGIAERLPLSLADLSSCPGIGSIRLERWGDEIISVLEVVVGQS
jgi:DNA helicase-2/ATP-dependent DNA helicase PcrA